MNEIQDIKDAIKRIVGDMRTYSVMCTVSDINATNGICNCTPIDGSAILTGVKLNANSKDGFKLIPKNNSVVIVTLINKTTGYVSMVSEVDEIHLNGTNQDGVVKVNSLVNRLNNLESSINALKTIFSSWVVVGGDGGAALKTLASAWYASQLVPTVKSDLENIKVKHGS